MSLSNSLTANQRRLLGSGLTGGDGMLSNVGVGVFHEEPQERSIFYIIWGKDSLKCFCHLCKIAARF